MEKIEKLLFLAVIKCFQTSSFFDPCITLVRHMWQTLSSFLFYHGDLPKVVVFCYLFFNSRAGKRMSSPKATSLLNGSDFSEFS